MSTGVSIVGYACRLPGAATAHEFWRLLDEGRCSVTEIPHDRFATARYTHPNRSVAGKSVNFFAGVIDDIYGFDAAFFGMSPREAVQADPQQRLLLQVVWESLEHAGIPPSSLAGTPVGVFVGASSLDYQLRFVLDPLAVDTQTMTGNTLSIISNRISYQLDLKGPSFTVDTACSSSLVALNQACEAIAAGVIDTAIVAGVNILGTPFPFGGFSRAYMLSGTGRCRAFDADGDGYVRGEGAVAIVIQSAEAARLANRRVRADIAGWGTNSDGRTVGLSMPSSESQFRLLQQVYGRFELDPNDLAFVEAHGTGTRVGDPAEANAIGKSLGARRDAPLLIGSVKTNIGHLEPASGMAGLLKALLSLENKCLPPSLHFQQPNPDIPFDELNIQVAATAHKLEDQKRQLAGINSFGFGGANAHVVLRYRERAQQSTAAIDHVAPLMISARSPEALRAVAARMSSAISQPDAPSIAAFANAAAYHRDHLEHRAIVLPASSDAMLNTLADLAAGRSAKKAQLGKAGPGRSKVAFAFSGNGSQWVGMGRDAYRHNERFRQALQQVDRTFSKFADWSLIDILHSEELERLLPTASVAQALLFAVQVGVVEALKELGIEPGIVFGHSAGEVAAAWASGALTLEQAIKIIHSRSTCQETGRGKGGMAAVIVTPEEAKDLFARKEYAGLEIAAINTGRSLTITGAHEPLNLFLKQARKNRWAARRLDVDYAYHSYFADPVEAELIASLRGMSCRPGSIPLVSSVYGRVVEGDRLDAHYWWKNIRCTVNFKAAVEAALAFEPGLIVEIGPAPVLTGYMSDIIKEAGSSVITLATLDRKEDDQDPILKAAMAALAHGAKVSMAKLFGPVSEHGPVLPLYPWQNSRYLAEASTESTPLMEELVHPLLGSAVRKGDTSAFYNHIDVELFPWLKDHRIENAIVFPGTGILEIALAAAQQAIGGGAVELRGCEIFRPLVLDPGVVTETLVRVSRENATIELMGRPRASDSDWTMHARARFSRPAAPASAFSPPISAAAATTCHPDDIYRMMDTFKFDYGPAFRRISSIERSDGQASAVTFSDAPERWPAFLLDPTVADSALHATLFTLFADHQPLPKGKSFLPTRIESLRLYQPGEPVRSCKIEVSGNATGSAIANITFFAGDGGVVAVAAGGRFTAVQLSDSESPALFYRTIAVPLPDNASSDRDDDSFGRLHASLSGITTAQAPARGDTFLLVEAASRAVAYDALKQLFGTRPLRLRRSALEAVVKPQSASTVGRILQDLAADGLLSQHGEAWRLADASSLPQASELIKELLRYDPTRIPEATYLSFLAVALPDILALGRSVPSISASLAGALESASAASHAFQTAQLGVISSFVHDWPAGKSVDVLLLGATDPAFVRAVHEVIAAHAGNLVVSDPRASRMERLRVRLAEQAGLTLVDWNRINSDLHGRFDLVIGAEVVDDHHRASVDILNNIGGFLSDAGALVLVEPAPGIFGELRKLSRLSFDAVDPVQEPTIVERTQGGFLKLLAEAGCASVQVKRLASEQVDALLIAALNEPAKSDEILSDATEQAERRFRVVDCESSHFGTVLEQALRGTGKDRPINGHPAGYVNGHNGSDPHGKALVPEDEIILLATVAAAGDPLTWLLERCERLMTALRSFDGRSGALWIIAPGAVQGLVGCCEVRPEAAALWGFARVACNEYPNVEIRLIDVSPSIPEMEAVRKVEREIIARRNERELLIDQRGVFGLRVEKGEAPVIAGEAQHDLATSRLDIERQGSLDRLSWKRVSRAAPPPGHVELEVSATGLNFRDVMWSLGLLPSEALESGFAGPTLGMECAGVVTRVGAGVTGVAIGDRCVAFAPAAFARHVVTPQFALARLPAGIDLESAATIPVAFLTAYYSLKHLARLRKGETVLIHGGAGGVGLAAIQIAQLIGAVPIVTAGSFEKQALLKQLDVEHVLHSRSLAFVDEVMRITEGAGVNVVLNSLAADAMERSIECLAPFGRFIELGKRDFFADTRIGLRPFRKNLSYFGVDADQLLVGQHGLAQELFAELLDLFEKQLLRPLPCRVFEGADVTSAFRLMQQAGHIGKIVVRPASSSSYAPQDAPALIPQADATYLIVGGFGGFGLALARRLVKRGARHVVLTGRKGASTSEAKLAVAELRASGASIYEEALDASDEESLRALFERLSHAAPPMRGIFHAAMVLDDALIENLTPARIAPVVRAKVQVAVLLDRMSRELDLDYFVLFSSATTLVGNPGQASYVAANAYLESLAQQRRLSGLTAVAIAWGAISDAGYLASAGNESLNRRLEKHSLKIEEALDALEQILQSERAGISGAVTAFSRFDWAAISKQLPLASTPLLKFVRREKSGDVDLDGSNAGTLAEQLATLSPEKARAEIAEVLCLEIGRILRISAAQIDRDKPLSDIGLDSLMGVELRLSAEERLGIDVPLMSIGGAGSLNDLSGRIVRLVQEKQPGHVRSAAENLIHIHSSTTDASAEHLSEIAAAIEQRETAVNRIF